MPPRTCEPPRTRSSACSSGGRTGAGATRTSSHSASTLRGLGYERAAGAPARPLGADKGDASSRAQIVGKVRLAATPPQNHWWNVALYVDARGLTTRRLRSEGLDFDVSFDFVAHELAVRTSRGEVDAFSLADGLSVAVFYERFFALLAGLDIEVEEKAEPFGIPVTTPFPEDTEHASYDREAVVRFWEALRWIDWTLQEFAGWFCGKTSPVHLFWHGLDLAVTRFSGKRAPENPNAD